MSARDLIEEAARRYPGVPDAIAQRVINNLTAAGYHIVGPDEVDPVTVERTLDAAGDYMGDQYGNTALLHSTDRARVIRAIASGGKQ